MSYTAGDIHFHVDCLPPDEIFGRVSCLVSLRFMER